MDSDDHTPEPWLEDGGIIQSDHIPGEITVIARMHPDNMWANARRIVACVNYCTGIPTDLMEARTMDGLAAMLPMYDKQDRQIKELIQSNNANLDLLKETIEQRDALKKECARFQRQIEDAHGVWLSMREKLQEATKQRDDLIAERETLRTAVKKARRCNRP